MVWGTVGDGSKIVLAMSWGQFGDGFRGRRELSTVKTLRIVRDNADAHRHVQATLSCDIMKADPMADTQMTSGT